MARPCTTCSIPFAVRQPVVMQAVAGTISGREAAARLGVPVSSMHRHLANCVPRQLAHQAASEAHGAALAPVAAPAPAIACEAVPAPPQATRRRRGIVLGDEPTPAPAPASAPAPIPAPASPASGAPVAPVPAPTPVAPLDILTACRDLRDRAMNILGTAEAQGDPKTALAAIREARGVLDSLAKIEERAAGHGATVPLHLNPEWVRTRTVLLTALADFPEARIAAAHALINAGATP